MPWGPIPPIHGPGKEPCPAGCWVTGQPFCLPLCPVAAQGAGWAVEASGCWGCLRPFSCCSPLQRGCPCKQFGSLVGLLGSLTSDCLATSQQRAWVCLGYLLQMQGEESGRFPALLSLILPPFLAWHHRGPAGPGPVPGREGGGNVLGWFCAPTLLALCHPSHLRKDPWERVAESHLPGLSVRLGGQGHLSLLSESRTLSPVLGTVPLHGCPLHVPGETEGGQTTCSDQVPDISEGAFPLAPCLQPGETGSYPGTLQTHACQGRNLLPSTREETNLLPRANWAGRRDLSCRPRACCEGVVFEPLPLQAAKSAACADEVTGRFPASQRRCWPVRE